MNYKRHEIVEGQSIHAMNTPKYPLAGGTDTKEVRRNCKDNTISNAIDGGWEMWSFCRYYLARLLISCKKDV
jgi:hypothetical protein